MKDILCLIHTLGTVDRGDRELDADIYEALGFAVKRSGRGFAWRYFSQSRGLAMRNYTGSIEDALTLAPDWVNSWKLASYANCATAEISGVDDCAGGEARTPALAICVAALRGRFQITESER